MTESQSRYGIMEEFNEKKLDAGKRLANLTKEIAEAKLKHTQKVQNLERAKNNEQNNYKQDHENWKVSKQMQIRMKKHELAAVVNALEAEILERETTYKQDHKLNLDEIDSKLAITEQEHTKFCQLKNMDETAIKTELKELDNAIKSLQEMSKENK